MSTAPSTPVDYDAIDGALGERYYKDSKDLEEKYTKEIIDVIRRAIDEGFRKMGSLPRRACGIEGKNLRTENFDPRVVKKLKRPRTRSVVQRQFNYPPVWRFRGSVQYI
jgi:hypothetical protein